MVSSGDNHCKHTALLFSISEDCHKQHGVNVGREKEAGVTSPASLLLFYGKVYERRCYPHFVGNLQLIGAGKEKS